MIREENKDGYIYIWSTFFQGILVSEQISLNIIGGYDKYMIHTHI